MAAPTHFELEEFFPQEFLNTNRNRLDLWRLIDDRLIVTAEAFRKRYGPMTINNWKWGGYLMYRGYRPYYCKIGAQFSAHRYGRALDSNFRDATHDEIREDIRSGRFIPEYLTVVEEDVNWLHISVENHNWPYTPYFINP